MKLLVTCFACLFVFVSSNQAYANNSSLSEYKQGDVAVTETDSRCDEIKDSNSREASQSKKSSKGSTSSDKSPPLVCAGNDQSVLADKAVVLKGTVTGGGKKSIKWKQVSGEPVDLKKLNRRNAWFMAPQVTSPQTLVFKLVVKHKKDKKDKKYVKVTDTVSIQVNPVIDATVVRDWNALALELIKRSERGPTISGRFTAYMNTALYSAWAAFDKQALGWLVNADLVDDYPRGNTRATLQEYAMASAAYDVFYEFAAGDTTMLRQKYLEIDTGEDAEVLRAEMTAQADALLNRSAEKAASRLIDENAVAQLASVRAEAKELAQQLLAFAFSDGSQVANDYADSQVIFEPTPWALPRPEREQRNKINFYNQTEYTDSDGVLYPKYTFPEFDPVTAAQSVGASWDANGVLAVASPETMAVNPAVASGAIKLSGAWQSLSEWGIFPGANDGGTQVPLTSHWGSVVPFALPQGSYLRPSSILTPYNANGELDEKFVEETIQVTQFAAKMVDGVEGGDIQRAQSEYWELGDNTQYPPGWWLDASIDLIEQADTDLKTALTITMSLSQAVFDAGIASWDSKFHFDSVRPFTVINQLFFGSNVPSFRGEVLAGTDDRDVWFPYQLRRNFTPPFPDIPSGHSSFSYAASTVLKETFASNYFGYQSHSFNSRFDLDDGFDGDPSNGNEFTDLSWEYLSLAAEEAGMSRLYGGIHMQEGNWIGLKFGIEIGHASLAKVKALMRGNAVSTPDFSAVWFEKSPKLLFGTMSADELSAHNVTRRHAEVYGFYGDDTLNSGTSSRVKSVELFGGYGQDTFVLSGDARLKIRDYELGETITIGRGAWNSAIGKPLSVKFVAGPKTLLKLGKKRVVSIDGHWPLEQLTIETL